MREREARFGNPYIAWLPGLEPPGWGQGIGATPMGMAAPGGMEMGPMPSPGLDEKRQAMEREIDACGIFWAMVGAGYDMTQAGAVANLIRYPWLLEQAMRGGGWGNLLGAVDNSTLTVMLALGIPLPSRNISFDSSGYRPSRPHGLTWTSWGEAGQGPAGGHPIDGGPTGLAGALLGLAKGVVRMVTDFVTNVVSGIVSGVTKAYNWVANSAPGKWIANAWNSGLGKVLGIIGFVAGAGIALLCGAPLLAALGIGFIAGMALRVGGSIYDAATGGVIGDKIEDTLGPWGMAAVNVAEFLWMTVGSYGLIKSGIVRGGVLRIGKLMFTPYRSYPGQGGETYYELLKVQWGRGKASRLFAVEYHMIVSKQRALWHINIGRSIHWFIDPRFYLP